MSSDILIQVSIPGCKHLIVQQVMVVCLTLIKELTEDLKKGEMRNTKAI